MAARGPGTKKKKGPHKYVFKQGARAGKGGAGITKGAAAAGGAAKPDAARVRLWRLDGRQGVFMHKSTKWWHVRIHYGEQLTLGVFKTEEEAIACYVLAEDRIAAGYHPKTGKYVPPAKRPKLAKPVNNTPLLGAPAATFSDAALGERATDLAAKVDADTLDFDQVVGVHWVKASGKWRAKMQYKKKTYQLGSITTDLAEAIRYRLLAEKAFGLNPDKNPKQYVAAWMAIAAGVKGAALASASKEMAEWAAGGSPGTADADQGEVQLPAEGAACAEGDGGAEGAEGGEAEDAEDSDTEEEDSDTEEEDSDSDDDEEEGPLPRGWQQGGVWIGDSNKQPAAKEGPLAELIVTADAAGVRWEGAKIMLDVQRPGGDQGERVAMDARPSEYGVFESEIVDNLEESAPVMVSEARVDELAMAAACAATAFSQRDRHIVGACACIGIAVDGGDRLIPIAWVATAKGPGARDGHAERRLTTLLLRAAAAARKSFPSACLRARVAVTTCPCVTCTRAILRDWLPGLKRHRVALSHITTAYTGFCQGQTRLRPTLSPCSLRPDLEKTPLLLRLLAAQPGAAVVLNAEELRELMPAAAGLVADDSLLSISLTADPALKQAALTCTLGGSLAFGPSARFERLANAPPLEEEMVAATDEVLSLPQRCCGVVAVQGLTEEQRALQNRAVSAAVYRVRALSSLGLDSPPTLLLYTVAVVLGMFVGGHNDEDLKRRALGYMRFFVAGGELADVVQEEAVGVRLAFEAARRKAKKLNGGVELKAYRAPLRVIAADVFAKELAEKMSTDKGSPAACQRELCLLAALHAHVMECRGDTGCGSFDSEFVPSSRVWHEAACAPIGGQVVEVVGRREGEAEWHVRGEDVEEICAALNGRRLLTVLCGMDKFVLASILHEDESVCVANTTHGLSTAAFLAMPELEGTPMPLAGKLLLLCGGQDCTRFFGSDGCGAHTASKDALAQAYLEAAVGGAVLVGMMRPPTDESELQRAAALLGNGTGASLLKASARSESARSEHVASGLAAMFRFMVMNPQHTDGLMRKVVGVRPQGEGLLGAQVMHAADVSLDAGGSGGGGCRQPSDHTRRAVPRRRAPGAALPGGEPLVRRRLQLNNQLLLVRSLRMDAQWRLAAVQRQLDELRLQDPPAGPGGAGVAGDTTGGGGAGGPDDARPAAAGGGDGLGGPGGGGGVTSDDPLVDECNRLETQLASERKRLAEARRRLAAVQRELAKARPQDAPANAGGDGVPGETGGVVTKRGTPGVSRPPEEGVSWRLADINIEVDLGDTPADGRLGGPKRPKRALPAFFQQDHAVKRARPASQQPAGFAGANGGAAAQEPVAAGAVEGKAAPAVPAPVAAVGASKAEEDALDRFYAACWEQPAAAAETAGDGADSDSDDGWEEA